MDASIPANERLRQLLTAALDGTLTEDQADQLAGVDRDLARLAWMAAAWLMGEVPTLAFLTTR